MAVWAESERQAAGPTPASPRQTLEKHLSLRWPMALHALWTARHGWMEGPRSSLLLL